MNLFLSNKTISTDKKLINTDQRKSAPNPLKSLLIAVLTLGLFLSLGTTVVHAATVSWDGGTGGSITINNAGTLTQNNADSIEHPRQSRDKVQQTITEIYIIKLI